MTYKEAREFLTNTGIFKRLGFVTEEEIDRIEHSMVIQAAEDYKARGVWVL